MNNAFLDELKTIGLFARCDDEALLRLLDSPYRRQRYASGKMIAYAGSPCKSLMLLTEGSADTRMISDEGRELMIEHLYAPQLLALVFLFSTKGVMPVDVIAHTECCVWYINREAFLNFMIGQPQVLKSFLQVLSDRGQFLSGKVQSFAVKGLRNRVLDYLTLQGSITSVTQVALQLGVARPSLSRVLAEMTTDGIIKKIGKGYEKV